MADRIMSIKEKIKSSLFNLKFFINNNPKLKKVIVKMLDQCPVVQAKIRGMWQASDFRPALQPPYGRRANLFYEALRRKG